MRLIFPIAFIFNIVAIFATYAQDPRESNHVVVNGVDYFFTIDEYQGCAPMTITVTASQCDGSIGCTAFPGDGGGNRLIDPLNKTVTYATPGNYIMELFIGVINLKIPIKILPNTPPNFDIFPCINNEVYIKITDNSYQNYTVTYPNNSTKNLSQGQIDIVAGLTPGTTPPIKIRGANVDADNSQCLTNTQSVMISSSPAAFIDNLTVLDETQIQLNLGATSFATDFPYQLKKSTNNTSTFSSLPDVQNPTTISVSNLLTDNNFYCFKLIPYNYCTSQSLIASSSNSICSIKFEVDAQNDKNILTWLTTSPPDDGIYSIDKNTGSIPTTPSPISDTDVSCGNEYTYKITSNYLNGATSISRPIKVTAISNTPPAAIENVTSVLNSDGTSLQLTWDAGINPLEYYLFRTPDLINSPIATLTDVTYADNAYTLKDQYCYKIGHKNICGNRSALSKEVCPLNLSTSLSTDNTIILNWNEYKGWEDGVNSYQIVRSPTLTNSVPNTTYTFTDASASTDTINQVYEYTIKATDVEMGLLSSVSNTRTVIKEPNIHSPLAFTPDGQGPTANEIFKVTGRYISQFEFKVYNRWGELLYTTDNRFKGWDGTYKGNPVPEGTYIYIANIVDQAGRAFTISKTLLLLRKK